MRLISFDLYGCPPFHPGTFSGISGAHHREMLPQVKAENLAEFCDIFCEKEKSLQLMSHATCFLRLRNGLQASYPC